MRAAKKSIYYVTIQGEALEVIVEPEEGHALLRIGDETFNISGEYKPGDGIQQFFINGESMRFRLENRQQHLLLARHGVEVSTRAMTKREHELYELMPHKAPVDTSRLILSPMPGKVIGLYVSAGGHLKSGSDVCVLEAMKMENVLVAEKDCVVEEVLVEQGDTVDTDQILIRLGPG